MYVTEIPEGEGKRPVRKNYLKNNGYRDTQFDKSHTFLKFKEFSNRKTQKTSKKREKKTSHGRHIIIKPLRTKGKEKKTLVSEK